MTVTYHGPPTLSWGPCWAETTKLTPSPNHYGVWEQGTTQTFSNFGGHRGHSDATQAEGFSRVAPDGCLWGALGLEVNYLTALSLSFSICEMEIVTNVVLGVTKCHQPRQRLLQIPRDKGDSYMRRHCSLWGPRKFWGAAVEGGRVPGSNHLVPLLPPSTMGFPHLDLRTCPEAGGGQGHTPILQMRKLRLR